MKKIYKNIGAGILLLIVILLFSTHHRENVNTESNFFSDSNFDSNTISRSDAIDSDWDSIKEYLNGTETANACSAESGNCYDLDADISNGTIDEIYFSNGGYLYFGADIDSNGDASDFDEDGNEWDFSFDMNSSLVDDAISEWASENNYNVE